MNSHDLARDPTFQQMLCEMVAAGEYVTKSCKALGMDVVEVYAQRRKNPEFGENLRAAQEAGFDVEADKLAVIADEDTGDLTNRVAVKRHELRIKTRQWLLEKRDPSRYGQKVQVEQKTATIAIPASDDPVVAQRAYEDLMKPR